MFSIHKNSYLHSTLKAISPRLINRCVQRARDFNWCDVHDLEPPFNRLVSEQPTIPVQNVDVTRRPLAFGRRAMPKLRRDLQDKDEMVVIAALQSISDLCHDPERGYEAISLNIVDRMVHLMLHDNPAIRERTANALQILARLADGRQAILSNGNLLENLMIVVEDTASEVRIHVAALLEMIARFWKAADVLIDVGFIPILLSNLWDEHVDIVKIHLETLKSLMYDVGKCIVLEHNAFESFTQMLDAHDADILANALDCLSLLTTSKTGEKLAEEYKLLDKLNTLLNDKRVPVHTAAASTLMYCTITTKSKINAAKISGMAERLIKLARNKRNPTTQIYAVKALTNICEHPDVRKEVRREHYQGVQNIQVGNENLKHHKEILLTIINWVPTTV